MPKIAATSVPAATRRVGGPPWIPVSCTAVWPLPRAISQRLSGTVNTKATASANESAPPEEDVAEAGLHRPGDDQHDRVVDDLHRCDREAVSAACAIGTTVARASPARSNGRLVSA